MDGTIRRDAGPAGQQRPDRQRDPARSRDSKITVEHLAPTLPGGTVTVTAELKERDGRIFHFALTAKDGAGVVATGTHERVSVWGERFLQKAEKRKNS